MRKEAFYSSTEIGTIDFTRLTKNIHGEFHNDVLEKAEQCAAIRQYLAPQLQAYRNAVAEETRADFVNIEPPLTEELAAKADARDKVQTGFKSGARAMMEMDDEAVRTAATVLFELTHKHNLHTDMNMDAQTDAIRDFVTDVRTNHMALLSIVDLEQLFEKLDALNEEVCDLQKDRFVEEAERERGLFAAARKATDEAYRELIRGVSAYVFVQGSAGFAEFISFLNSIIIYYRRVHLKQHVDTSGEGGTPGSGGGDQTPGGGTGGDNNTGGGDNQTPGGGTGGGNDNTGSGGGNDNTGSGDGQKYTIAWYDTKGTPLAYYHLPVGATVPEAPAPPAGYRWPSYPTTMPARDVDVIPVAI